ncbi:DNA-binding protein [candidate division KSB1 bacterium]|nr:MAG: DNA-binding protein [candidate division KSB1 bacterium]
MSSLADANRLQYWITVGREGAVEVTGEMVKDDDDGFFAKLKSNLKDIPFRAYIVQRSLAGSKVTIEVIARPPDLMDTNTAAKYIDVSKSKMYKLAESGVIPRTPNKKFRRTDLDAYLSSGLKGKKRSSR